MLNKIWINKENSKDEYAEFITHFSANNFSKVKLYIVCDGSFTFYVNNIMCGFGACADYPDKKLTYTFNLKNLKDDNELKILVWHIGENSFTYIEDNPFVAFKIFDGDKVIAKSNEDTLSRKNINYKNGYKKIITGQLGYSFLYDNTIENNSPYTKSIVLGKQNITLKQTKNLKLLSRLPIKKTRATESIIIDMKKEVAGFLDIEIDSKLSQKLLIAYGEHLENGHVKMIISTRDFSVEVILKKGLNSYINTFRRLAGRYLEIFCDTNITKINYAGIRPVVYPLITKKISFEDKDLNAIYNTSVYTLKCCMHEHYEDCPWREQALYSMDSRNQMLCGYYAFKGHEFQRHNIILMKDGQRKDGLLSLCSPAGLDVPIPFFSLVYPISVYEYIEHTKDRKILAEVKSCIKRMIKAFDDRIEENGLIANFRYPYWNFYEWSDYSNNDSEIGRKETDEYIKEYDLILNCAYVYSKKVCDKIFNEESDLTKTIKAIDDTFYIEDKGMYKLSTNGDHFSQLGNSFALLIGLGNKELVEKVKKCMDMIPITLSMNTFFYDALLKSDKGNSSFIINDIKKKYLPMIKQGATTFWETEKGYEDFGGAGSLCHGWSATPVYYLNKLEFNFL